MVKHLIASILLITTCALASKDATLPPREPLTIFVHGTRFLPLGPEGTSFVHRMLSRHIGTPEGLKHVSELNPGSAFAELAHTLCEANPSMFSLKGFYFYGWSGSLNPLMRMQAGRQLYYLIQGLRHMPPFKDSPVTAIAHSHGGNVILNSASTVIKSDFDPYCVDRLILLACPVQFLTEHYAYLPIFKSIYNLYSGADIIQVIDPQKLHSRRVQTHAPFFSLRTFKPTAHIKQAKIRWHNRALAHNDFISKRFFKKLPAIIELLESQSPTDDNTYRITLKK